MTLLNTHICIVLVSYIVKVSLPPSLKKERSVTVYQGMELP